MRLIVINHLTALIYTVYIYIYIYTVYIYIYIYIYNKPFFTIQIVNVLNEGFNDSLINVCFISGWKCLMCLINRTSVIIHNNLCRVHSWSLYEHQNNMLIVSHQLLWFWIQTLLFQISSCLMIWPVWDSARTINWFLIIQRDSTGVHVFWVQRDLTQEHTAGMWRLKRVQAGDLE